MAMKLYFNPHSRAVIAKWMLDEAGAAYEIMPISFEKREHKSPAFLRVNPAGKLPALVDGRVKLFENPAICMYIAEKFPQARLAPLVGSPDRGRYLSLMVYSTAQIEPSMSDDLFRFATPASRGWNDFETVKDVVEREIGYGPYLFGPRFTAADVMVGSMFVWQRLMGGHSHRPKIDRYIDRLLAREKAPRFS